MRRVNYEINGRMSLNSGEEINYNNVMCDMICD